MGATGPPGPPGQDGDDDNSQGFLGTLPVPTNITPSAIDGAAPGTSSEYARADHIHSTGAGTPTSITPVTAAATGTGPAAAMTDHVHGVGIGWVAGNLTSITTINNTVTYTTGGVTYSAPAIAAGQVYRIIADGVFTAANSGTARNSQVAPFWGTTQLPSIGNTVLINTGQSKAWRYETLLQGIDTTHVWAGGKILGQFNSTTIPQFNNTNPVSTAVTSGAQTIDLRFSMSVSVAGDLWLIASVIIERLN